MLRSLHPWLVGWLYWGLRRFSDISAISRLGSRRLSISEIQVAKRGIEPPTSCSASQELNHSVTTAPLKPRKKVQAYISTYTTVLPYIRNCWRKISMFLRVYEKIKSSQIKRVLEYLCGSKFFCSIFVFTIHMENGYFVGSGIFRYSPLQPKVPQSPDARLS